MPLPAIFAGAVKLLSGGLGEGIVDFVKGRFPAKLSDAEKAQIEADIQQAAHAKEMELQQVLNDAAAEFNDRIKSMEGTASDLKSIPIVGPIILFLRGLQRPVWGFAVLYFDYMWFTGEFTTTEDQGTVLLVVNLLVLGFLFGERAIKNLEPLLIKVFAK